LRPEFAEMSDEIDQNVAVADYFRSTPLKLNDFYKYRMPMSSANHDTQTFDTTF